MFLYAVLTAPDFSTFNTILFSVMIFAFGGGLFAGGAVLAVRNTLAAPRILLRTGAILAVLSLYFVIPEVLTAHRAGRFLAGADSTRGRVKQTVRASPRLIVEYQVDLVSFTMTDEVRLNTATLGVGDSVWVHYDRHTPHLATVGRPGTNWGGMASRLGWLWFVGGILITGYGTAGIRTQPETEQAKVGRFLRAYLAAAVVADLAFGLSLVLGGAITLPLNTPLQDTVAAAFLGGFVSLILTLVLAGIGWMVLLEKRWTTPFAYALCGVVLGGLAIGVNTGEPVLMIPGAVAGLAASLTFRHLNFRSAPAAGAPSRREAQ